MNESYLPPEVLFSYRTKYWKIMDLSQAKTKYETHLENIKNYLKDSDRNSEVGKKTVNKIIALRNKFKDFVDVKAYQKEFDNIEHIIRVLEQNFRIKEYKNRNEVLDEFKTNWPEAFKKKIDNSIAEVKKFEAK